MSLATGPPINPTRGPLVYALKAAASDWLYTLSPSMGWKAARPLARCSSNTTCDLAVRAPVISWSPHSEDSIAGPTRTARSPMRTVNDSMAPLSSRTLPGSHIAFQRATASSSTLPLVTTAVTSSSVARTSAAVITKVGGTPVGLGGRLQRLDSVALMSAHAGMLSHALRTSFVVTFWSNSLVSRSQSQTCSS